jgi:type II secretory pathway pseudopilin PulG
MKIPDNYSKRRTRSGFTLLDLMVAMSIFMTLSVILVLNFRIGRNRDELKEGASLVSGYLEQAQTYALAGKTFTKAGADAVPRGGWGVHIDDQSKTSFIFFSDHVNAPADPDYILTGDDVTEVIPLPNNVAVNNVCVDETGTGLDCSFTVVDYVLSPPYGIRHINQNPATNHGGFTVEFIHNRTGQRITVTVNAATGLVSVGSVY